jgi:hypothetical protein
MAEPRSTLDAGEPTKPPMGGMSIRVFTIRQGKIIKDSGTRYVDPSGYWDNGTEYPPCSCPHCQRQQANR